MRDERTGIADGRQKVHVPPAEQSHLQIAHQVGGFVIEEEVRRCFRQLPTISVRLPEVIVEVKVFATAPNAPVRHPQQAGLAWLEGALELTAEGNFVRNRTASKPLLPTRAGRNWMPACRRRSGYRIAGGVTAALGAQALSA